MEARGARRYARGKSREAKLADRESAAADAAVEAQRQRDEATADLVGANAMIVTLRSELAESEARGARRYERVKSREAKLAARESTAADAAIEAQRQRDEAAAELVGANATIGALQLEARVVKWSAESRRFGAVLAARADGRSSHDVNSSSPGGAIDAPVSAVVGVGAASEHGTLSAASVGRGGSVAAPPTSVGGGDRDRSRRLGAALAARADGRSSHDVNSSSPGGAIDAPVSAVVGVGAASEHGTLSAASVGRGGSVAAPPTSVGGGDRDRSRRLGAVLAARADGRSSHDVNSSSPGGAIDAPVSAVVGVGAASEHGTLSAASVGRGGSVAAPPTSVGGGDRDRSRRLGAVLAAHADGRSSHDANSSSPGGAIDAPVSAVVGVGAASEHGTLSAASVGRGGSVAAPPTSVGGGDRDRSRRLGAVLAARADGRSSHDVNSSSPGGAIDAPVSAVVGVGAASEHGTLSAASVGRGGSVAAPPTSVGGGDRDRSRRLGAVLAARADGRSSHDVNSSSPGGAIDAPVSAVVGVGAASEHGTLSAASVGRGGSVAEPPTSVGGGDRDRSRRLGAVLAARADGRSSHDVNSSSPGGAIDAPVSAVVGVGAASEHGTLSAASVGRGGSVAAPPTSVGGGDRDRSRRLGAVLAARADGRSSHDVNSSSPGGAIDAPVSAVVGVGAASEHGTLSAASVGRGGSVAAPPTSVGGGDRDRSRRLGAVLAARADGRSSHDVNSSSPGGAIDAPVSAVVGVGAASEHGTLSAASVGRGGSVAAPPTSVGGGDRDRSRRLGAVLAARADGRSSHDVNSSSPGGAIDAPVSAVVGVGAASEHGTLSAASVGRGGSVAAPPTSVGGGDRDRSRRLGAVLAARADGRSSHIG